MIASILESLRVRSPSRMVDLFFERLSDRGPKIALTAGAPTGMSRLAGFEARVLRRLAVANLVGCLQRDHAGACVSLFGPPPCARGFGRQRCRLRVLAVFSDLFEGLARVSVNCIPPGEGLPTTDRHIHIFRLELE